ncbi:MAG: NADH-quinone oxidoreductase subunit C [Chloroflexi bacterium]|nr:NADH-quinone oxidoreductase subunit C [Chloroflexota bacterium]
MMQAQVNTPLLNTAERLEAARQATAPFAASFETPEPHRLDVYVDVDQFLAAAGALHVLRWGYLASVTGLDRAGKDVSESSLEVLYHFCSGEAIVTLRIVLARENPRLSSLCGVYASASIFEREVTDLLGIVFEGAPDTHRLVLADDWPDGIYPLRKDADLSPEAIAPVARPQNEDTGNRFVVPIGPQHPALKEPGHFEFTIEGETVVGATVRLGYAHRGIEKMTEQRNWVQNLYLLERVCGICSHIHATAYCQAVEQLAEVTIPARAEAIRTLFAELERLHSHMLWLGVSAHEAGFDTLFMYSWRDRETVMDLLEQISGNRVHYSANVLGGVKFDLEPEHIEAILSGMDLIEERSRYYLEIVSSDPMFKRRTVGVGVMSAEQAEDWTVVGPTARGSGVAREVRFESPYLSYRHHPPEMILDTAGDLAARFRVRVLEMLESCRYIRVLLADLPTGDLTTRMPRKIKAGETISRVEAPRGELMYFIRSGGGDMPERIRVRTPTLCNLGSVLSLSIGRQLADVPMILAGVDPCFSCNDRTITLRRQDDRDAPQTWTWDRLRRHGIEVYR